MNKFWVVALETYKKHVKSMSFVMMILAPILFLGISYGSGYISSQVDELKEIAVVSEEPGVAEAFKRRKPLILMTRFLLKQKLKRH